MNGGHDQQNENGLEDAHGIALAPALESSHETLTPARHNDVGMSEGRAQNATANSHEDGRQDSNHIHRYQILGGELGLEETEVVLVLEAVKG